MNLALFKLCNSLEEKYEFKEPVSNAFTDNYEVLTHIYETNIIWLKSFFLVEDRERVCSISMCLSLHMYWSDAFSLWEEFSVTAVHKWYFQTKSTPIKSMLKLRRLIESIFQVDCHRTCFKIGIHLIN